MSTIIAITNQKGGVGKTTTSINLAYYLAKQGFSTLLVDFDPQGNASSGVGLDKNNLKSTISDVILGDVSVLDAVVDTEFKNLSIIPALPTLANTEVEMTKMEHKFSKLKTIIDKIREKYEYIIIDCPPSLSLLTVNALIASHYVLLPVQAEFYALEGLGQLLETMKLVRKNMNPTLNLMGVLPTMVDSRTSLSGQVLAEVTKHFPAKVFKTVIPRNVRLAEAPSHGVPIGEYDRFSKGARAYKALAKEVIARAS